MPSQDTQTTSFTEQRKERDSWMLFQFPTRLPRIQPQSTLSGMALSSETLAEEAVWNSLTNQQSDTTSSYNQEDEQLAQIVAAQTAAQTAKELLDQTQKSSSNPLKPIPSSTSTSTSKEGYDDTLKDVAAGKYGKIVCYKSGKMELVVGEESDTSDEIRMLIYEGLQSSFMQQAVVIDPDEGSYIPLGKVKKSMIVVPNVDSAFAPSR